MAVLAAMLIAGCGGGGSDTEASGEPLGKAEFVKRADAICIEAQKSILAAAKGGQGGLVSGTMSALRTEVRKIRALPAPAGDEAELRPILEGGEEVVKTSEAGYKGLIRADKILAKVERLADEYGFKVCLI